MSAVFGTHLLVPLLTSIGVDQKGHTMRHVRAKLVAASAVAGMALTGCGGSETQAAAPTGPTGGPVEGGNFVFAEVTPINNWQIQEASFYEVANVLNSVVDRLTYFDPESGELVGWIAEEFEMNDDATEFVFTIQEGVTFSDGSDLDAEAVKANLDALGHGIPEQQVPANPHFMYYESAQVTGDNEVTVTLSEPDVNFLRATSSVTAGLVSEETLEGTYEEQDSIETIAGSGPFEFESQTIDEEVVFTARDDYEWAPETAENQGAPYLDSFTVRYLPEISHRPGAVQTHQVDLVRGIQPVDEAVVEANGHQILAPEGVDLSANQAALRIGSGLVEDPKVRQALNLGIDREELHEAALSDSYEIAGSILNHGDPDFIDFSDELEYDPQRANELLDEAGWKVASDGIREKNGERLEITVAASNNSVVIRPAFEVIEQQWREIGVQLINRAADNAFLGTAYADDTVEIFGTRQFIYGGLGAAYGVEESPMLFHADEDLVEIFDEQRAETDPEAHAELVAEEQWGLVVDKAYTLPLWDEVQVYGAHNSVYVDFTSGTAPILQGAWKEQE